MGNLRPDLVGTVCGTFCGFLHCPIELKNLGLFSVSKSSIYLKVLLNFLATEMSVRLNVFKFKRKKKKIRNQRCTIGTHWDTDGLLKNH